MIAADLLWLALGWVAYAALHSALAGLGVKEKVARRWPGFAPRYRLAYNLVAILTVLPLAWATWTIPGDWLWRWTGAWAWLANGLALAALAGVVAASKAYDMPAFLGLRPSAGEGAGIEEGPFRISPLHRFVRHPWYALALVVVWTRDMNPPLFVSALAVTAYFIAGSRLEEAKLVALHGNSYRRYRAKVPGFFPLPWKRLSPEEAAALEQEAASR